MKNFLTIATVFLLLITAMCDAAHSDDDLPLQARRGLREAATYYHSQVAVEGGYVYHYSLDLQQRFGEGDAGEDLVWVQPPATPTVGMAYLQAHRATGDAFYLDAAREAADVLVYGQLRSGGWANSIDVRARRDGYPFSGGNKRGEGNSSLDDGQTQAALQLLMLVDEALEFKNAEIHTAAQFGLDSLLAAQFTNGAFPQVWRAPVAKQPILKASYPDYDWRSEGRIKQYWDMYTTNDNVPGYVAETLIVAHRVYQDDKYLAALRRLGNFLILAQMPEPQPAWAQQYNYQMHPIWARKFEPAAIAGDESQEVIATLLRIAEVTGDRKYRAPIPRAIAYLKRCELSDGSLARYYELKTNRPLYMQRRGDVYTLTYDDSDLPKHYSWKNSSKLDKLERAYEHARDGRLDAASAGKISNGRVLDILEELDAQGRWISTYQGERLVGQPKLKTGEKYLSSALFSRNITLLAEFLSASEPK